MHFSNPTRDNTEEADVLQIIFRIFNDVWKYYFFIDYLSLMSAKMGRKYILKTTKS